MRLVQALRSARSRHNRRVLEQRFGSLAKGWSRPIRLHLGCGANHFDGWINLDLEASETADVVWNLKDAIPLEDGCCEFIYSEHVLEHFPVKDGVALLRECRRLLSPEGVVRIAMPSLEDAVSRYLSPDWRDQDWLSWPSNRSIATPGEMLNASMRWWGHEWLYDREELERRLREAGFSRIEILAMGESSWPELLGRETRQESLLIAEASP